MTVQEEHAHSKLVHRRVGYVLFQRRRSPYGVSRELIAAAAIAVYCLPPSPAAARIADVTSELKREDAIPMEPLVSNIGTGGPATPHCMPHEIVAITTNSVAIVTRAGDTLQTLQTCYSFDVERTDSENELFGNTLRSGQIILLFK
jgi:hypothetical protein